MTEDRITKLEQRLDHIEKTLTQVIINNAREESNHKYIVASLEEIKSSQKDTEKRIDNLLSWLARLIIGAFILAILSFVFSGGLLL